MAELDGEVEALAAVVGELAGELLDELEQAAAASPMHAMPTVAANRVPGRGDRKVRIPRR